MAAIQTFAQTTGARPTLLGQMPRRTGGPRSVIEVLSFDFDRKRIRKLPAAEVEHARDGDAYCWLRVERERQREAEPAMRALGLDDATIARVDTDESIGQLSVGRGCIQLTLVEAIYDADIPRLAPVHVVLGDGFLVTMNAAASPLMDGVLLTYEDDFKASARSGGFLLFEIVDHLIDGYRRNLATLSHRVERVQSRLLEDAGDDMLSEVSILIRALLDYRKCVVSARECVHELATRRSSFVQETTQPYLEKQALALERLAQDASTERTVLSDSLSLYMGLVSHRTNKVVTRLTIVSMIFLPLSFLAALYGMNFEHMPELHWRYGYLGFWILSGVLVVGLVAVMKHKRWI